MYSCCLGFYLLLLTTLRLAPSLCENHYSIVAPGTIRSNRHYSVGVSLHDAPAAATVRVSIRSLTSALHLTQDVTVQPHETKLIDFMPPLLREQFTYELRAEGIKGIELNESKELLVIEKGGPRIYVESDKGLYKPGDIVQFRVIILNEHLKVTKIVEPIRIQIMDPQKNRVKQYKDIQLNRGVFTGKFQLSKQPILGEWKINTYISGKYNMHQEYKFKVEKYVLPKFSVHIENDRNLVVEDRIVRATIYGKYTYGKYVQGTVDVQLKDFMGYNGTKQTAIIDNGDVKVDVALDIGNMGYSPKMIIVATLREKYTNITATGDSEIILQQQRYKMFVPDSSIELRDNKPYRLKLHVQHWDGTPVTDSTAPVEMLLQDKEYASHLDKNGVAQFEFEYQPTPDFGFSYKNSFHVIQNDFLDQDSDDVEITNCHLAMKLRGSEDLSAPLEIDVTSKYSMPYLIYTVTSHGDILREEFIKMSSSNEKSYTLKIKASIAMVPQSYLFVHYILNGQLHYCELTMRLPEKFENQISISGPTSVKPGQEITMNIKGRPNSRVSILAVDKSVLLLNFDNVLKKKLIMEDLLYDRSYRVQSGMHYTYYPGHTSGLIIITSAKYKEHARYTQHTFGIWNGPWSADDFPIVRSLFPETWIFQDIDIDKANTALTLKVPDTITTWIVRAFSVNDETGFGLMDGTLDIQAYKPFFISLNLPYSVKRGEIVTIAITIFNYLKQNLPTEVTMTNANQDYQFMDDRNRPLNKQQDTLQLNVPANGGKSVAFMISPNRVGNIDIQISAKNSVTSDALVQKLKVEPEGIVHQYNRDEMLTLSNGQTHKTTFKADIPANIVPESEYVVFSVSGDVMVTALENLDGLVLKPTGCGEQNMINFSPNILILDYLKALDKYTSQTKLVAKAKNFIETGYQKELTYRHPTGGYSVFGPDSSKGESNWLTAYVTRFFMKAMKYSAIEARIIEGGLDYLVGQQLDDGSFPQRGYLFHPAHQNQYGFTAFVLLTFLEDTKYSKKLKNIIQKGMTFLTSNVNNVTDIYSLAIMVNVFQKAGNDQANAILDKLKTMSTEENGLKWWTNNKHDEESANDVEITAYILMALLESPGEYLSVFNWLVKQRTSPGGFASTHDTVVGLQALIKYAEKSAQLQTQESQLKVNYVAKCSDGKDVKEQTLEVDGSNELILQKHELPPNTRSLDVEVTGTGRVYLQFSYQYYVSTQPQPAAEPQPTAQPQPTETHNSVPSSDGGQPAPLTDLRMQSLSQSISADLEHQYFIINPTVKLTKTASMTLSICYTYQPITAEDQISNMVIMQVQFPSGYTSNSDDVDKLREEEHVSRVDVQNPATMLEIYFETLEANVEECLTIMADKSHDVDSLKPSPIKMYDYYTEKRSTTILYKL